MVVLRPDLVRFGSNDWEGVQRVSFDRFGTRTIEEWGDEGAQLVFADVSRIRVKARVIQSFETTDLESPIPGEMEELRIEVSGGSDVDRKIVRADAVVESVSYAVGGSRSERTIILVCVSDAGDADPVTVTNAN
ncbi:MAG: hypothetical protein KC996_00160 [Phycisphaerales bacterium]|nr:hypothetical protein [Phycisphaerales bacterium]